MTDLNEELYQLSRLALAGRRQDIQLFVRRLARRVRPAEPAVADRLDALVIESPTRDAPLHNDLIAAVPVDTDSRLQLVRPEYPVPLDVEPVWDEQVRNSLDAILAEREHQLELLREGLAPARTMLFTGPPGVGKSLAARWLAKHLDRPLLTLDLSAVMSSFLGKTGSNVRHVLDYAKGVECVLFLDELDAVAKRRDDNGEIGELKRLVTVLLQEIDDWPPSGLLLAATNHPDLLDPAVWRRFDVVVEFPMPTVEQVREAVGRFLAGKGVPDAVMEATAIALAGQSFSDVDRDLRRAHRDSVVGGRTITESLRAVIGGRTKRLDLQQRRQVAGSLLAAGFGQRQTSEWTGVHRNTLRKIAEDGGKSAEGNG